MKTNQKVYKTKTEAYEDIRNAIAYLKKQQLVHQEWTLVSKLEYYYKKFKAEITQIAINEEKDAKKSE